MQLKKMGLLVAILVLGGALLGCHTPAPEAPAQQSYVEAMPSAGDEVGQPLIAARQNAGEKTMPDMQIRVGDAAWTVKLYDNDSARALVEQMPFTLEMADYGRQEKVVALDIDLPDAQTVRPATIRAGELYLWSGDQLVLFYTTFENSYGGYVPLGAVGDTDGFAAALGGGNVAVTFSVAAESD